MAKSKTKASSSRTAGAAVRTPNGVAFNSHIKGKSNQDAAKKSEPLVTGPAESDAQQTSPWSWAALADPSPSKITPLLTADGR
jgi:hypothetical protein